MAIGKKSPFKALIEKRHMKANKERIVLFNGAVEDQENTTSALISNYIRNRLTELGYAVEHYNIVEKNLPLLDLKLKHIPAKVQEMVDLFGQAELHFWLAPLYHGGIPGVMKNCLDWLEVTAENPKPYLTDIKVGLICWADGSQAMQGINNMDSIAKALRAWTLPYTVPIVKGQLTTTINSKTIDVNYSHKLDRLIHLALSKQIITR